MPFVRYFFEFLAKVDFLVALVLLDLLDYLVYPRGTKYRHRLSLNHSAEVNRNTLAPKIKNRFEVGVRVRILKALLNRVNARTMGCQGTYPTSLACVHLLERPKVRH